MDDRELDLRLRYIEEKVTNIEVVMQNFLKNLMRDKDDIDNDVDSDDNSPDPEKKKKKIKIVSKNEED